MDLPLDRWPALRTLGPGPVIDVPSTGTMNDTWIVRAADTPGRVPYVLRRHRFRSDAPVRAEHRVMAHARRGGIPVPDVLPADGGELLVRHEDRWWTLYGFSVGSQVGREEVSVPHARAMGVALGELHGVLADLDRGTGPPSPSGVCPAGSEVVASELLDEISALRSIIKGLRRRRAEDDWADEELAGRAAWIEEHGLPEPEAVPDDEVQALHGDYQETNLFFASDGDEVAVTGIIDWDKAEVGARGFEVVRCLKLSLRFTPELCDGFLEGYRTTAELSDEQLLRSVRNEHARDVRGLWLPRMIYRHGEDRLRRFLRPGGFRTVLDEWPSEVT